VCTIFFAGLRAQRRLDHDGRQKTVGGLTGRTLANAALIGALVGAYSSASDLLLGPLIGTPFLVLVNLGNAAAPWIVAGFAAGATTIRTSTGVASGVVTLLVAVATYYLTQLLGYSEFRPGILALWLAVAMIVGPLFGAAGSAWRRRHRPGLAVGVLSGALIAEAASVFGQLGGFAEIDLGVGRMQLVLLLLVAAVIAPPLLLRGWLAVLAYGSGLAFAVVGFLAISAVSVALDAVVRI
jgi:hypothetical protein